MGVIDIEEQEYFGAMAVLMEKSIAFNGFCLCKFNFYLPVNAI
jgi:hypothetical protein